MDSVKFPVKPKNSSHILLLTAIMKEVKRWAKTTGMHGPLRIESSNNKVRRIFWILLVLAGTIISVYQIAQLATKYYSYPYKITRTIDNEYPMLAPAISICNVSPVRLTELNNLQNKTTTEQSKRRKRSTEDDMNNMTNFNKYDYYYYYYYYNWNLEADTSTFNSSNYTFTGEQSLDNLSTTDQVPSEIGLKYSFLDLYGALTTEQKWAVGTNIDQFLIDCVFNQSFCSKSDFIRWLHPNYGSCFTFNGNDWNDKVNQTGLTMKAGLLYAFSAIFFIDQANYIAQISQTSGLKVALHEPSVMPQFNEDSISAIPGFESTISFKKKTVGLLSDPYEDNCYDYSQKENILLNNYAINSIYSIPKVKYSQSACYVTCLQKSIEKSCNCSNLLLPPSMKNDNTSTPEFSICKYKYNSTSGDFKGDKKCIDTISEAEHLNCLNLCRPECKKTDYSWKISQFQWPSTAYAKSFKQMVMGRNKYVKTSLIASTGNVLNNTKESEFFSNNFVKLVVNLETNEVEHMNSEQSYLVTDFLADLGGQCGLWLGFSVITFFEIAEFLINIFFLCVKPSTMMK